MSSATRGWLIWAFWLALLAAWSFALLSPTTPKAAAQLIPTTLRFYAAKGLHLTAYAFLTCLAAWLPAGGRWGAWIALLLHAAITEWLQTFVPGRSGSVSDVLINCTGIGLGLLAAWSLGPPLRDGPLGGPGGQPGPQRQAPDDQDQAAVRL